MNSFLSHPFLFISLIAATAASITSGIVGSYVVVKRIVFISGSIAHSVIGGIGFSIWLKRSFDLPWLTPIQGAIFAAILSAFLIGWIHIKYRQREDTVIAMIWSTGMAIGVVFISLTPGYNIELMNFLFGNILWISTTDLIWLFSLAAIVILITLLCHVKFQAVCFDENQAELRGISVKKYYLLLLNLVAISVVVLIQIVGAILVIAMLTIPSAIAEGWSRRLSSMMNWSIAISIILTSTGLLISNFLNWPPGATIALTAVVAYLFSLSRSGLKN